MIIKKGFTLSEVMITLGVLGVLAAILVPVITNSAPDRKKVMFKKAYSTLEKTVSELINDDVDYPSSAKGLIGSISVEQGFNYTAQTGTIPASVNKFCYLLSQELNTVGTVKCGTSDNPMGFTTTDGITWSTRYANSSDNFPLSLTSTNDAVVFIDVNGSEGPNCGGSDDTYKTSVCGSNVVADQYEVGIRFDGKLYVDSLGSAILENPMNNKK